MCAPGASKKIKKTKASNPHTKKKEVRISECPQPNARWHRQTLARASFRCRPAVLARRKCVVGTRCIRRICQRTKPNVAGRTCARSNCFLPPNTLLLATCTSRWWHSNLVIAFAAGPKVGLTASTYPRAQAANRFVATAASPPTSSEHPGCPTNY